MANAVKQWLLGIAFKKIGKRLIQLVVAWLAAQGLDKYGVQINPELLTATLYGLLELARNYLKVKKGLSYL